ncbi:Mg transporter [Mycena indigotica]|uniref:Mg transporter n=1 Tax=Mycena indigotica TaxID=2126181 RepID=A0A8H6S9F5_9AGAR|nr:Mg transporter [Mycena indigotica]KAF7294630.1 Mg transporter [Mycena indigotica]
MSAEEPESQKRTSFGRLEEPLRKDSWLSSHHGAGCVSLAIRRLRSPPEETISPLTSKTDNYEMILDYLDSDDPEMIDEVTGQPMRPYVSFVFKFKMLKEHGAVPLSITNSEADTIVIETPGRNSTQEIDSPTPPSLSGSIPSPRKRPPRDHLYDSEVETLLERRKRTKTRMDQVQQENLQRREEIRQLLEGLRQTVKSEETALVRAEQESQDLKVSVRLSATGIYGLV